MAHGREELRLRPARRFRRVPGAEQFFLRPLALADVCKDHHRAGNLVPFSPQRSDGVFDGDRTAVFAPEDLIGYLIELAVAQRGVDATFHDWIRRSIGARVMHRLVCRLADQLGHIRAEHPRRGGILKHDPAGGIDEVDAIRRRVQDGCVQGLQLPQALLCHPALLTVALGPQAEREVAGEVREQGNLGRLEGVGAVVVDVEDAEGRPVLQEGHRDARGEPAFARVGVPRAHGRVTGDVPDHLGRARTKRCARGAAVLFHVRSRDGRSFEVAAGISRGGHGPQAVVCAVREQTDPRHLESAVGHDDPAHLGEQVGFIARPDQCSVDATEDAEPARQGLHLLRHPVERPGGFPQFPARADHDPLRQLSLAEPLARGGDAADGAADPEAGDQRQRRARPQADDECNQESGAPPLELLGRLDHRPGEAPVLGLGQPIHVHGDLWPELVERPNRALRRLVPGVARLQHDPTVRLHLTHQLSDGLHDQPFVDVVEGHDLEPRHCSVEQDHLLFERLAFDGIDVIAIREHGHEDLLGGKLDGGRPLEPDYHVLGDGQHALREDIESERHDRRHDQHRDQPPEARQEEPRANAQPGQRDHGDR